MAMTVRRTRGGRLHIVAEQKDRMGLFIRTIGIARATTKIGMANLVYNIKRFIFLYDRR
jgi:transposase, IS5 family